MADLKNTVIADTGYIRLPSGSSAQRPTNPPNGATRFNTDLGYTECYYLGFWFDLETGRGLPRAWGNRYIHLDASVPESTNGTTAFGWKNLSPVANRDFEFIGGGAYTSSTTQQAFWKFDGNQMAVCQDQCNDLRYNSIECVFRKFSNSPEDILYNKEETWETKTDNNTFQWAWQTTDRSWFWSNSGNITVNEWYHCMITYNGQQVVSYVNGRRRQIDTGNYENGSLVSQSSWPKLNSRGSGRTDFSNTGHHDIAMFIVYDRALDDYEVYHNYMCASQRFGIGGEPYN